MTAAPPSPGSHDPTTARPGPDATGRRAGAERSGGRIPVAGSRGPVELAPRSRALLELLDDASGEVWGVLRRHFEDPSPEARRIVAAAAGGARARARGRARRIRALWERREVVRRLLRHVVRPRIDLESALFLLGRLDTHDLDARPYRRVLDTLGNEVARSAADRPEGLGRAMALVETLRERGFDGDLEDYSHPHNIHLHRAIERRSGMPLTLTAIYLSVARRAGIRAAPIPIPGHVFLRLYAGRRSVLVDPFHGGELRTRRDLTDYLSQHGLLPQPSWFRDTDDAHLLHRHVLNLMNSCKRRGRVHEARDLHRVARALAQSRSEAASPAGVPRS